MEVQYLLNFEEKMQNELLRLCTERGALNGVLLASEDISEHWAILAPEYMADAVPQVAQYPTVSVAWAAYLGMAIARGWDADWNTCREMPYQSYYGEHGFDDMDESIVRDLLCIPLESKDARELEEVVRRCGETAVALIRHEQVSPQSEMAFHVFARTCKVMYLIGAAIQLKRMGYSFQKVDLN